MKSNLPARDILYLSGLPPTQESPNQGFRRRKDGVVGRVIVPISMQQIGPFALSVSSKVLRRRSSESPAYRMLAQESRCARAWLWRRGSSWEANTHSRTEIFFPL